MSREDRRIERSIRRGMRQGQNNNYGGNDDDLADTLVWIVVAIAGGAAVILFALGWVDQQFGWGLKDAFVAWISSIFK